MKTPSSYRNHLLNLLGSALLFLFAIPAQAQTDDIRFQHFGPQEGLPIGPVHGIYQDRHGFLWFDKYKYDGRKFRLYPKGTTTAVRVGELLSDNWGGAPDSLFYFDPVRDAFIDNYPAGFQPLYGSLNAGWSLSYCTQCFLKGPNQSIWFGTPGEGIYIYHQSTKTFDNLRHSKKDSSSISSNNVSCILKDQQNQIWVGTWDGGLNLWVKEASFIRFRHDEGASKQLLSDSITALQQDHRGVIWIGTPRGLNWLDPSTGKLSSMPLPASIPGILRKIFTDSGGKLWLGLEGHKVVVYDPLAEKFIQYLGEDEKQPIEAFSNSQIFSIAEDNRKRIWLGSPNSGVAVYDLKTGEVSNYRSDPRKPEGLYDGNRRIVTDRNGRIWIGTFNGVSCYDPNAKSFAHVQSDREEGTYLDFFPKWDGLEDRDGNIWLASYGGGLIKFDPETEDLRIYKKGQGLSKAFQTNNIVKITEDDAGNIWITENLAALHVFNPSTGQFTLKYTMPKMNAVDIDLKGQIWAGGEEGLLLFSSAADDPTLFRWDAFQGELGDLDFNPKWIKEGCSGALWIGTVFDGLLKVNIEANIIQHFPPDPENPSAIAGTEVFDKAIDEDCNLWMTLPGKGLTMLPFDQQDRKNPVFQLWSTANSNLPHNGVISIKIDRQGRLWTCSKLGVSRVDPVTNSFYTYGPDIGMKTIPTGIILAENGRIYVRGLNGIGYFHPDQLAVNEHIPPVYLKDIQIDGKSLPLRGTPGDTLPFPSPHRHSITFTDEIRLKHDQNDIRLEFVALNYTAPERNQFKYQLIGYDEEWQLTDAVNPYATYTNLDPGEYTFRVIGANNDGYWNTEGATLEIIITPPWWRTGWAYFLYAVLILAGVLGIYRFQLNRQLAAAETRRLRELDEVKTRLYTNITHEFRTPLTVILGMGRKVLEQPKDWFHEGMHAILRNGERLLHLVEQMLDLSKLETGSMPLNTQQSDVIFYLKYLVDAFQPYAAAKDIDLHFLQRTETLMMDFDPDKLAKILQNLLSNAVKHTPKGGNIYVQAWPEAECLMLGVKDSGEGIPEKDLPFIFDRFYRVSVSDKKSTGGTGIGLALTKELVGLMNGTIEVKSVVQEGTEFLVKLPITRTAEVKEVTLPEEQFAASPVAKKPTQQAPESSDLPSALIIEDQPDVARYIAACIERDYQVFLTPDGKAGIEKAIELVPDVIISDVMMPEKDGYEVTAILKQDFRTSHIPIILLTAKADADSRLEGLEQGADAYLTKPFQPEELEVRLRKLVELRRKLQQRYVDAARLARFSKSGKSPDPEDSFLQQFRRLIEEHMSDEHFGTPQLLKALGMSRTQLHNKLKALTGKPTSHVIRSIRLQRAKELLENTELNVSEVAFEVGFNSLTYFSSSFSEEFGAPPSEVRSRKAGNQNDS